MSDKLREKTFLYLWGQPGCGKSTLIQALVGDEIKFEYSMNQVHLIDYADIGVTEMGRNRESFRGTDALGMAVINDAIKYLTEAAPPFLMAEGDRLANDRFFLAAIDAGYVMEFVYLDTPDEVAAARRDERGSNQNPSWVKGRITKAARLAENWEPTVLDGSKSVPDLVDDLMACSVVAGRFQSSAVKEHVTL